MNAWTRPADLRAQLQRLWDRDALLHAEFPLRLSLRGPASAEWSERFEAVRGWAAELAQAGAQGWRFTYREVRHRVIGTNQLPAEAWVDTLDDALRLIGKLRAGQQFRALVALTQRREPRLLPWLQARPRRALELADDWPRLLDIVAWLQAHPRPRVYLRQVDLPGVHSKFIESRRAVLAELFDLALAPEAIDEACRGVDQFAARYGFLDKPQRVRLRFLDPGHRPWVAGAEADYTLTAAAFGRLAPDVRQVFITENEVNFLAFPAQPDSLIVFGAGYGFDALAQAGWLQQCRLHYWGDIDTHGFGILDQLRAHFSQARSLLMDRGTLLAHQALWGEEPQPLQRDLPRLDADEQALYDDLRWRRLAPAAVRLEQERIAFSRLQQALDRLRDR